VLELGPGGLSVHSIVKNAEKHSSSLFEIKFLARLLVQPLSQNAFYHKCAVFFLSLHKQTPILCFFLSLLLFVFTSAINVVFFQEK